MAGPAESVVYDFAWNASLYNAHSPPQIGDEALDFEAPVTGPTAR